MNPSLRDRARVAWHALCGRYEVHTYSEWLAPVPYARRAHVDIPMPGAAPAPQPEEEKQ